jgi:plasmid stabilization system protein ParE
MTQITLGGALDSREPVCSDIAGTAERELGSFFAAVKQLFGPEEAELAARDWLDELQEISHFPAATRNWRQLTINAAKRLALRVNH